MGNSLAPGKTGSMEAYVQGEESGPEDMLWFNLSLRASMSDRYLCVCLCVCVSLCVCVCVCVCVCLCVCVYFIYMKRVREGMAECFVKWNVLRRCKILR